MFCQMFYNRGRKPETRIRKGGRENFIRLGNVGISWVKFVLGETGRRGGT